MNFKIWIYRLLILASIFMLKITITYSQEARVITFKHTLRWLDESSFPNYFLLSGIRDSINGEIQRDLIRQYNVSNVSFPDKVDYKIITGFGKPKNSSSESKHSAGYDVEIYSVLTRATAGYAVFWSVNLLIRKEGKIILEKEAKHEIENSNTGAYMTSVRWLSPYEFQKILGGLIKEALGLGGEFKEKIIVGRIEDKEKEIGMWFPESSRYILKKNGSWLHSGNFSAQLVNEKDTIMQFGYKNKVDLNLGKVSLKPILANLFTELTRIETSYTIIEKERKSGKLEFSNGQKMIIELNWIEKITTSTITGETERTISVPLVGQLYGDSTLAGSFIYENISKTLVSKETKEKFNWVSGAYTENSFGTVVIHRIIGTFNNKPFTAEYNELFGFIEIKTDNQTLSAMVFQNCNPKNLQSFDKQKLSKNKLTISESGGNIGNPSLDKEEKVEWYPIFIKKGATPEDMVTGLGILVCLFFGIGNM